MTELRIGEILALRSGRVDLLRGTVLVAETCYKGHRFGSFFGKTRPPNADAKSGFDIVALSNTAIAREDTSVTIHVKPPRAKEGAGTERCGGRVTCLTFLRCWTGSI